MTDTNELWQIYGKNGQPIEGRGISPNEARADKSIIIGNTHIWLWKQNDDDTISILLQKRSMTKTTYPGWFHMSVGGHIDLGETPIEGGVREAREELGLTIDPNELNFLFTLRDPIHSPRDIRHVYSYQLRGDEQLVYEDGEVESCEWRSYHEFKDIVKDPKFHTMVDSGKLYFDTLRQLLEPTIERSA